MGMTELVFKVTANARSAVAGLKPLQTSLKDIKSDSDKAEKSLEGLSKGHKVDVDDDAIGRTKREITRLRESMRHDLSVDVNADTRETQRKISGLRRTLRELERDDVDIDVKLNVDEHGLHGVKGDLEGLEKAGGAGKFAGLAGLAGTLGKVAPAGLAIGAAAGGIALVATGVGKLAINSLKLSDQMAQAKIAFTQFLGSGAKADKLLGNLTQLAAKTPFEFPELVASSQKLLSFGINSKDIIGTMKTLGDTAALTGSDVSDLADIWGQMKAKGKVANEELLQLTERGIPAYQILSDKMHKPVSEIQDMASKGKLLAKDTLPILQQGLNKTFGGGMAKQAETLSGKMSTVKDTISGFGRSIGEALTPVADALLDKVMPALTAVGEWLEQHKGAIANALMANGAGLVDYLAGVVDGIGFIVDAIGPLVHALDFVSGKIGGFLTNLGELINKANEIPGIGKAIPDDLGNSLIDAGGKVKDFGDNAERGLGIASDALHGTADDMRTGADNMRKAGRDMLDSFRGDELTSKINAVKSDLADLAKKPPSPKVDADIAAAKKKLRDLRKERADWNKSRATATLDAKIDTAQTKLGSIRKSLNYLKTQKPTPQVKAKIEEWTKKYKDVQKDLRKLRTQKNKAKIEPSVDQTSSKKAKGQLNDVARPGGKGRKAPISAETSGLAGTENDLNHLARDRTVTLSITTIRHQINRVEHDLNARSPSANSLAAPGGGGSIVPQLFGTGTAPMLRAAATAMGVTAPVSMVAGYPQLANVPQRTPGGGERVELAPRQVPIKVYLDGQEIATHLELRAQQMASVGAVTRRSA